jgi:hypothetical protein
MPLLAPVTTTDLPAKLAIAALPPTAAPNGAMISKTRSSLASESTARTGYAWIWLATTAQSRWPPRAADRVLPGGGAVAW